MTDKQTLDEKFSAAVFDGHVWVRFRTMHSSGPGEWRLKEFATWETSPKAMLKEFEAVLEDEWSTHSDHWRGIQIEFYIPTRGELNAAIADARERRKWLADDIKRHKARSIKT